MKTLVTLWIEKALTDITQLGSATIGGEKADTETVRIDSRKRRYVGGLLSYGAERLNFDRYLLSGFYYSP